MLCACYLVAFEAVILAQARIQARLTLSPFTFEWEGWTWCGFISVLHIFTFFFRPSASYFSLLAQRKCNQKKGHPSFRLFPALLDLGLSSVALPDLGQAVAKLDLAAYKKHKLLRDSDKRSLLPYFACATRRVR